MGKMLGTTVLSVRHKGKVVMAGDGQVTLEHTVMKHTAKKVRKIYNDKVLAGLRALRRMPSPCLRNLKKDWASTTATLSGPQWNWPRTGGRIDSFGGWRP